MFITCIFKESWVHSNFAKHHKVYHQTQKHVFSFPPELQFPCSVHRQVLTHRVHASWNRTQLPATLRFLTVIGICCALTALNDILGTAKHTFNHITVFGCWLQLQCSCCRLSTTNMNASTPLTTLKILEWVKFGRHKHVQRTWIFLGNAITTESQN